MDTDLQCKSQLPPNGSSVHTGDTNDSAAMNIWLHKAVMTKLAANGGQIPADLFAK